MWIAPFVFGLFTLASWALRPAERMLPSAPGAETRPAAWIVPIVVIAVMLVIAFVTLPKGVSPF
jgi:hypothetical protein